MPRRSKADLTSKGSQRNLASNKSKSEVKEMEVVEMAKIDEIDAAPAGSWGRAKKLYKSFIESPKCQQFTGEYIGTFMIVLFGTGSVATAVLTGAQQGLWQIAVVWGFGVTLSILCSMGLSGAHLNPAVTLTFALIRPNDFSWRSILLYWSAQYLAALNGGIVIYILWINYIEAFEKENSLERGSDGSFRSAMMFGEYFPAPPNETTAPFVSPFGAMLVEAFGTGVLTFVIFALTDSKNSTIQNNVAIKGMTPFFIGFTVASIISILAPLTQAGLNPARDFGPRVVAALAGWGAEAIPGPRNGFWIYILGPMIGGPLGAAFYEYVLGAMYRAKDQPAASFSDYELQQLQYEFLKKERNNNNSKLYCIAKPCNDENEP